MFITVALSRRHFSKLGLGAFFAGLTSMVHAAPSEPEKDVIKDCRGRSIPLENWQRIAVIGGTLTETLYALGVGNRIIGVDSTSTWPTNALKEKPSFGYMRSLSPEGILSLEPDLILTLNDAGPASTMDHLIASHVPVFFVESTPSPEAIERRTRLLARLVQKTQEGDTLCRNIQSQWDKLAVWRNTHKNPKKVLFILRVMNGRPLVAGRKTASEQIITLAGGSLISSGMEGYKVFNSEAIAALKPDVILTMSQSEKAVRTLMAEDSAFKLTPAGKNMALIAMEGQQLLGFGPRTAETALLLAQTLNQF